MPVLLDTGCSKVVDSCKNMLSALGYVHVETSMEIIVCVHACDDTACIHMPYGCHHATGFRVLMPVESNTYRAAWARMSPSQAILNTIKESFNVRVPSYLPGINLEDMFIDPKTGRRFFYRPKASFVHCLDRESGESHHKIVDCEMWRCGFYILQTVWLRCASMACALHVPRQGKLQSQYLPDHRWEPGRSNTFLSSAAFAKAHTVLFLTKHALTGVLDARQHRVVDVRQLVESVESFLSHKHEGKKSDVFGWRGFFLTREQRLRVACEVGKIVAENLGHLTFAW